MRWTTLVGLAVTLTLLGPAIPAEAPIGYYRQPALADDTVVFVAEGDLWKVSTDGGVARRLTSHPGDESEPAISPDGTTLAFVARYEGPRELYTMPLAGGLPVRRTYGADGVAVSGWTADGRILYGTELYSTLPNWQLVKLDIGHPDVAGVPEIVPLAQAADGWYGDDGVTLYFTRLRFQGSHTKRYRGGTAQTIWRYSEGDDEAMPLTGDYPGTSKRPMYWNGRVYFASDRDDTMNLWSMNPDGTDLQQHTRHEGWDVASPYLDHGRIVYQLGADLRLYDIASDGDRGLRITLDSDLDQLRERWIDEPMDYVTSVHLSPEGDRVALTARGRVYVAPHRQGRLIEATRTEGVRFREGRFMPDGKTLLAFSDQSGEVELWTVPANGVGDASQLTDDGAVLRWEAVPSPDGKTIAHHDKNQRLYVYDVEKSKNRLVEENPIGGFSGVAWSPDGKWLAYVAPADNLFARIKLYDVAAETSTAVTSDRFDSYGPVWSADGEWLYFLSDRNLVSIVGGPWGAYQPEPFLDKTTQIYHLPLKSGLRSPFAAADELQEGHGAEETDDTEDPAEKDADDADENGSEKPILVTIELDGIEERLEMVPIPAGNYGSLQINDKGLFWLSNRAGERKRALVGAAFARDDVKVETVAEDVTSYEVSADGKKLLLRKTNKLFIVDAAPKKADLDKKDVKLDGWRLSVVPREEWRQVFIEAWRLERDYFYAPNMHGVDWPGMLDKYLPLVDRVTTRAELSDLIAQMVGELSALHIFVRGGDRRSGPDEVHPASLGAVLTRDEERGGYLVERIYRSDPDDADHGSPLTRPGVGVEMGDVIESINGTPTLAVPDMGVLLRNQAGRQVLLRAKPPGEGEARDVIVEPITLRAAENLRYDEWEYTRRLNVERKGEGDLGYVHLRAMGGGNYTEWAKGYFPVFNRKGLIIDVRHNRGGNIDSWILNRLLRKVWFHWSQRVGRGPVWNMQYAFRGHIVVLCNERTASDGEAFTEGVRRLDLGTIIGTRTWGGEIWLTGSNFLVDRGVATAAEFGVFGPDGEWLIEGHGVDPDIVVDNPPHATFKGEDAQLEAAIEFLRQKIREEPVEEWVMPPHPDKSAG